MVEVAEKTSEEIGGARLEKVASILEQTAALLRSKINEPLTPEICDIIIGDSTVCQLAIGNLLEDLREIKQQN